MSYLYIHIIIVLLSWLDWALSHLTWNIDRLFQILYSFSGHPASKRRLKSNNHVDLVGRVYLSSKSGLLEAVHIDLCHCVLAVVTAAIISHVSSNVINFFYIDLVIFRPQVN